jgi:hypothetical protein
MLAMSFDTLVSLALFLALRELDPTAPPPVPSA